MSNLVYKPTSPAAPEATADHDHALRPPAAKVLAAEPPRPKELQNPLTCARGLQEGQGDRGHKGAGDGPSGKGRGEGKRSRYLAGR